MSACDVMMIFVMVISSGGGWLVGWLCGYRWTVKQNAALREEIERMKGEK